jgi:hypothetical protein
MSHESKRRSSRGRPGPGAKEDRHEVFAKPGPCEVGLPVSYCDITKVQTTDTYLIPTAPFRGLPHTTSSTGGSDWLFCAIRFEQVFSPSGIGLF